MRTQNSRLSYCHTLPRPSWSRNQTIRLKRHDRSTWPDNPDSPQLAGYPWWCRSAIATDVSQTTHSLDLSRAPSLVPLSAHQARSTIKYANLRVQPIRLHKPYRVQVAGLILPPPPTKAASMQISRAPRQIVPALTFTLGTISSSSHRGRTRTSPIRAAPAAPIGDR
jgi:hypothetical protein